MNEQVLYHLTLKGQNSQKIVDKLEKQNIILAVREIKEKKIIRASPHFFNTDSEILQVIDVIKKLQIFLFFYYHHS